MKLNSAIPALPVQDMEKGVAFYRDVLGFDISHQASDYAVLKRDHVCIHLWAATDESWKKRKGESPVRSGAETFIAGTHSCRLSVEGIDAFYAHLEPKDVIHPNGKLGSTPWGTREFSVLDPYGNLITYSEKG